MSAIRRRNGRKPACEPCRRRKLACDHGYPSCTRCQKQSVNCIYLENPSTRAGKEDQRQCSLASPPRLPDASNLITPLSLRKNEIFSNGSPSSSQRTPVLDHSAEYLGPTSFTSVFMEHSEHFEVDHALRQSEQNDWGKSNDKELDPPGTLGLSLDRQLLHLGVQVLRNIPDEWSCNVLFSKHVNPNDGWIRMAGQALSDSMWHTYGKELNQQPRSGLLDLACSISNNSSSVLVPEEDPQHWIQSFSGKNIRWEALGILYTYWAFGAISSSLESEVLLRYNRENPPVKDAKELMMKMKNCALICMDLCKQLSSANVLLVYLLYKHSILESIIKGDKSTSSILSLSYGL